MFERVLFSVFEGQYYRMKEIENEEKTWFRKEEFVPKIVDKIIQQNPEIGVLYAKIGYSAWFPRFARIFLEGLSAIADLKVTWISFLGIPGIRGEVDSVFDESDYLTDWGTRRAPRDVFSSLLDKLKELFSEMSLEEIEDELNAFGYGSLKPRIRETSRQRECNKNKCRHQKDDPIEGSGSVEVSRISDFEERSSSQRAVNFSCSRFFREKRSPRTIQI